MTRREDHGSRTEHDAALWEAHLAQDTYDDGRPSLADCIRDEADDCLHLHQTDTADFDAWPPPAAVWVCDDCGTVCEER